MRVYAVKTGGSKYFKLRYKDPATGKWKQKSSGCTRRREAERCADDLAKLLQKNCGIIEERLEWSSLDGLYRDRYISKLGRKSQGGPATTVSAVTRLMGVTYVDEITTARIAEWIDRLLTEDPTRTPTTIENYTRCLRGLLNWAAEREYISSVPTMPRLPGRKLKQEMKGRPILDHEFDKMIEVAESVLPKGTAAHYRTLMRGLYWGGLRLQEALRLRWEKSDKHFSMDFSGEFPMFWMPAALDKARRDRLMPTAPEFVDILNEIPRDGLLVFQLPANRTGTKIGSQPILDTVSKRISAVGEAAGIVVSERDGKIKYASAHDLRRSFGTRWASKLSPSDLQLLMRHANIQTTMRYYVHADAQSLCSRLRSL